MADKIIVITGGASGIGLATAKRFLAEGDKVFILDKQAPVEDIPATFIQADLLKLEKFPVWVDAVLEQSGGRIDTLVCSAGIHLSATVEQTTAQQFFDVLNINFTAAFFMMQQILPVMKNQMSGAIVLLGSDQSFVGKKSSAIYGASKAAIAQLCKSTALDYAAYGIKVNAVCPGTIDTPFYRKAIAKYQQTSGISLDEIEQEEAACQPVNRIGGADEVSETIYFAASDKVGFMTGSLLTIDGGYTAM